MLAQYLAAVTKRRWQYGALDCATFMADWLVALGFADPMADRRETYSAQGQVRLAIKSEGGMIASCEARFAGIGLRTTDLPAIGDVALVMAPYGIRKGSVLRRATGAICVSTHLSAIVTDSGLMCCDQVRLPRLKVWAICHKL